MSTWVSLGGKSKSKKGGSWRKRSSKKAEVQSKARTPPPETRSDERVPDSKKITEVHKPEQVYKKITEVEERPVIKRDKKMVHKTSPITPKAIKVTRESAESATQSEEREETLMEMPVKKSRIPSPTKPTEPTKRISVAPKSSGSCSGNDDVDDEDLLRQHKQAQEQKRRQRRSSTSAVGGGSRFPTSSGSSSSGSAKKKIRSWQPKQRRRSVGSKSLQEEERDTASPPPPSISESAKRALQARAAKGSASKNPVVRRKSKDPPSFMVAPESELLKVKKKTKSTSSISIAWTPKVAEDAKETIIVHKNVTPAARPAPAFTYPQLKPVLGSLGSLGRGQLLNPNASEFQMPPSYNVSATQPIPGPVQQDVVQKDVHHPHGVQQKFPHHVGTMNIFAAPYHNLPSAAHHKQRVENAGGEAARYVNGLFVTESGTADLQARFGPSSSPQFNNSEMRQSEDTPVYSLIKPYYS